jgi:ketosteroid isomerase-like protein
MKKIFGILIAAILSAVAFGSAADEVAIKRVHTQFEKAIVANDMKAVKALVLKHFAPEFMHQLATGQSENRDQFIKNMNMPGAKFLGFKFTFGKMSQSGNTMIVPVKVHVKAQMKDAKGKMKTFNDIENDVETWVKKGSSWQMTKMKSSKLTSTSPS